MEEMEMGNQTFNNDSYISGGGASASAQRQKYAQQQYPTFNE